MEDKCYFSNKIITGSDVHIKYECELILLLINYCSALLELN